MIDTLYDNKKIQYLEGYPCIYDKDHHKAFSNGLVFIHIIEAEKKLGRDLHDGECVHHCNFDKLDYSLDNLWIFKTGIDHSNYHSAIKFGLNFTLKSEAGVMECFLAEDYDTVVCPICGSRKTCYAKYCFSCTQDIKRQRIPSGKFLRKLLTNNSYSEIGRMYDVTPNAVKKWAKRYNIYEPVFKSAPDRDEFIHECNTYQLNVVAKHYNVHICTINRWIKELNVQVEPYYAVCCVETGITYKNRKIAAIDVYKDYDAKYAANMITKSCKTGESFQGYHWHSNH